MNFAERLKELRADRGLTQADLSLELGLSRAAIAGYENSGKEPTYETLMRIATYFGVTVDYMLGADSQYPQAEGKDDFLMLFEDVPKGISMASDSKNAKGRDYPKILFDILTKAKRLGVEEEALTTLVEYNLAFEKVLGVLEKSLKAYPDELLDYEDEHEDLTYSDDAGYREPQLDYKEIHDNYNPKFFNIIRADHFRSNSQDATSDAYGVTEDFCDDVYVMLSKGELKLKRRPKRGNGDKKGK